MQVHMKNFYEKYIRIYSYPWKPNKKKKTEKHIFAKLYNFENFVIIEHITEFL